MKHIRYYILCLILQGEFLPLYEENFVSLEECRQARNEINKSKSYKAVCIGVVETIKEHKHDYDD